MKTARECPTPLKVRHATLRKAKAGAHGFARELNREKKLAEDLYAYPCPGCRGWHITRCAEWNDHVNTLVFVAAPEALQRWAMGLEDAG